MIFYISEKKVILQPRKITFKNRHKGRRKTKYSRTLLTYGSEGLRLLQPTHFTSKQIFRLNIFLKKSSRKSEKTKRSY